MAIVLGNWEAVAGVERASRMLRSGSRALDVLVAALRAAESDLASPVVGPNGLPNILGEVELDASLMDGGTLQSAAVGALRGFAHPISVAHELLQRLPHVFLVGEGAARFAREVGAEEAPEQTEAQRNALETFLQTVPEEIRNNWPPNELAPWVHQTGFAKKQKDTAVCLVMDQQGSIASGASTSGWPLKYPGRLGDSPVVGAGHYCHNRYGAAACTHTGEMTLRALTAHTVVTHLRLGASLEQACHTALDELRELKGGTISDLVIYAIDHTGRFYVLSTGPTEPAYLWHEELPTPEPRPPKILPL